MLAYLKYWWQSKGRHGTHSPFVYNLVEQALHQVKNYDYSKLPAPQIEDISEWKKLFRIINYLPFEQIYADKKYWGLIEDNTTIKNTLDLNSALSRNSLVIIDDSYTKDRIIETLKNLSLESYVLFINLDKNTDYSQQFLAFTEDASYHLTCYAWSLGILSNSQNYKRKQHYILR